MIDVLPWLTKYDDIWQQARKNKSIKIATEEAGDILVMPIVKLDQTEYPGQFSVTSATDTWPIGTCLLDFELSREGAVISSDTIELQIVRDITV